MSIDTQPEGESRVKDTFSKSLKFVLDKTPRQFRRGPLWGLASELEASGFINSPEDTHVVNTLGEYQVALNDLFDFRGANRPELDNITSDLEGQATKIKQKLNETIDQIADQNKRVDVKNAIENSVIELEFIESYVRSGQIPLTIDNVDKYRNVVNAINEIVDISLVLGIDRFKKRLAPIPKESFSWESIYEKYRWVFEGQYENEPEKYLIMLHNLAMSAQLVDDWHDIEIDRLLGIPSFGVVIIDSFDGNKKQARKNIAKRIRVYKDKAQEICGVGYFSQGLFVSAVGWFKATSNFALRQAKYSKNTQIRERFSRFVKKSLGNREQKYIAGELDFGDLR